MEVLILALWWWIFLLIFLDFLLDDQFPDHLKKQIEDDKQREANEKKKQEMEKQMCKVS